ncbi:AraC family transcriptional regulator [Roseinatronobacter sp. S2]|uniref:AraC family transcriptional regulator n=1 Tax=Roseinatronobacter sp. S2 TaxID=3035471 RepID=UPI00240FFEB9|nr:AraC family transcriptional regulator [Roseinatronobacter sp. S2]WFE76726.1 AraC family transcriptional regulator [Roseinatronobacter sp. S2]
MKQNQHKWAESAVFEHIEIPENQCFLWRKDHYPWARNVWNFHPEFELHLIRKSSGLCYIGDYIGQFDPGQLTLVGSGLPHDWITLPSDGKHIPERDIVVQFNPETFASPSHFLIELEELNLLFDRAQFGLEFSPKFAKAASDVLEGMGALSGLDQLVALLRVFSILAKDTHAKTLATSHYLTDFRPGSSLELKRLDTALNYLRQNFLQDIKLSDAANAVGMSESAFSRFFKNQTGNTFTQHITTLRIWMAKRLLKETDNAITEICFDAGFSNISNFNRVFLKATGLRPSAYRQSVRKFS